MPPLLSSRKLLLSSSNVRKGRLEAQEEDDGLYNVRRVQTLSAAVPPETPSTRMRLRSMARREAQAASVQDSPQSSSAQSTVDFGSESKQSSGFMNKSMLIFTLMVFSVGGYLAYNPQTLVLFKPSGFSPVTLSEVTQRQAEPTTGYRLAADTAAESELSVQMQREYQRLRSQHEQSLSQLKHLNDKMQKLETMRQLEADVHSQQEADHLGALNRQIAALTAELKDLKAKYGEINQNLATSTYRNAKLESEVAEKLEQIKIEVEAQSALGRAQMTGDAPVEHAQPMPPNLATLQNGARIVKRYTTVGMADEEHWSFWFGKAAASLFPSGRYQPLMGVQTHPAEAVLDERSIRGPGDCFCVRGLEANITLDLGLPIYVNRVAIEHAPRQLETHRERAPWKVSVYALRHELEENVKDVIKLEMSSRNPDELVTEFTFAYPEERAHFENIQVVKAQRLRFHVESRPGSNAVCVYRVVVNGNVSD